MLKQGNSQFLNNFNNHQFDDQISLANQINGIVSKIISNNNLLKHLKNKMNNGNGNAYLNLNRNIPQLQYQNQNQNQNNNVYIQDDLNESNLLDLMRNLSIEPSNQNKNNYSLSQLGQSLYGINTPLNVHNSINNPSQNIWPGGGNINNNGNNYNNNNLLLKQALLLQLINNDNQINNKINNQLNNQINNQINNQSQIINYQNEINKLKKQLIDVISLLIIFCDNKLETLDTLLFDFILFSNNFI